ncbi:MAG: 1-acyl-sn-glycerol-3-phosphate acyltransferase [Chlamydiae bacterium]|nr:1-acyl-sn-glycerol-3-phosphate acyltransferase [Chlamydiota bacterium]
MRGWLNNSHNLLYKVVLFLVYWFFAIVYRHRIYGLDRVSAGAAILAANHTSFYDPPLLSISTPFEVHFLARKTLFDVPLFSWLIRKLNAHPVSGKAQDVTVLKTVIRLLREGKKVIIFPEGHRSHSGELQPIKPGVALLLGKTDAALIPVYLYGTFRIWPKGKKVPRLWGKTACAFGEPLRFPPGTPHEEVAKKLQEEILALKVFLEEKGFS